MSIRVIRGYDYSQLTKNPTKFRNLARKKSYGAFNTHSNPYQLNENSNLQKVAQRTPQVLSSKYAMDLQAHQKKGRNNNKTQFKIYQTDNSNLNQQI